MMPREGSRSFPEFWIAERARFPGLLRNYAAGGKDDTFRNCEEEIFIRIASLSPCIDECQGCIEDLSHVLPIHSSFLKLMQYERRYICMLNNDDFFMQKGLLFL